MCKEFVYNKNYLLKILAFKIAEGNLVKERKKENGYLHLGHTFSLPNLEFATAYHTGRVRLVGRMEKWENRKLKEDGKVEG